MKVLLANRMPMSENSFPGLPKDIWIGADSFFEASLLVSYYIQKHDLGASTWAGGEIRDKKTDEKIGSVSYNGRVWDVEGKEIEK